MYSHILACVDGSYDSEVAAKYALGMAKEAGAIISIITVENTKDKDGYKSLERLERIASRRKVTPDFVKEKGDRIERVKKFVENHDVDAIVASSGGRVKVSGTFPNNFSQQLINKMEQTVFIIKSVMATTALTHKKLLNPVQSATPSQSERVMALSLISRIYDCPVSLLRCHKIKPDQMLTPTQKTKLHNDMRDYLIPLKERFDRENVRTYLNTKICYSYRKEVLDYIERNNYDLCFLRVTQGRFPSFVRKDFSIEIMKNSECNVILWKPYKA